MSEPSTRLYPEVPSPSVRIRAAPSDELRSRWQDPELVTESHLNLLINESKQHDRIRYMKDKQNDLLLKLKHYQKIKHHWTIARRILDGIGITAIGALSASSIVLTAGVLTTPIIPAVLTGGTLAITGVLTTLDKSLLKRRERAIKKKQLDVKEILDKLHFYFEKCREDNVITLEEMEAFDKIVKQSYSVNSTQQDSFLEEIKQTLKSMSESQLKNLQKSLQQKK